MGTRQEVGIFVVLLLLAVAGIFESSSARVAAEDFGRHKSRSAKEMSQNCKAGPGNITARQRLLLGLRIPLDTASEDDLTAIPGIGPFLANGIVRARQGRPGFQSLDDLLEVRGIGAKRLAMIRPYLCLADTSGP
jgi:DNA uptake protein ComE-like DNA-binding protein